MIIENLDDAVLDEVLFGSLNLAFPLWTRKWLALLDSDADVGIRIKKDLKLGREVLGFSFSSNRFGLRGPCDPTSSTAVFGTSYAMGFSVDDGDNWYDGLFRHGAMNYGLPVGLREFEILFDGTMRGPAGRRSSSITPTSGRMSRPTRAGGSVGRPRSSTSAGTRAWRARWRRASRW